MLLFQEELCTFLSTFLETLHLPQDGVQSHSGVTALRQNSIRESQKKALYNYSMYYEDRTNCGALEVNTLCEVPMESDFILGYIPVCYNLLV